MKDENIKSICCFGHSNMILKNNGELFVFGNNEEGKKFKIIFFFFIIYDNNFNF